jgi:nucleoside-diphosphate-sugar epimerase
MKKILVTGANGFIGQSICKALFKAGRSCIGTIRSANHKSSNVNIEYIPVGNIGPNTNWRVALSGIDCIIHCAGKVHEINENSKLEDYQAANVDSTQQLALQAAEVKVRRLIFLSSIKVNGERTINGLSFSSTDFVSPKDPYSLSKYFAEKRLWEIHAKTGLQVVIVRLPLVYGFGTKGNLKNLIQLVNFGMPLPFSLINNRRSLIGIDNLIDLLISCIDHPEAKGKTFLVSDDEDLSTPDLINYIALAMGRSARLFPFPVPLLKFLGFCTGRSNQINRLIGSLQLDIEQTKKTLNWSPQVSAQEGIRRMVQGK